MVREHGPLAPGHARHGAHEGRARGRDHRPSRPGDRLPAPRLPEELRERHLDPVPAVHGPAELRVRDDEQLRLPQRRGEAHRPGDPGARPVHPRHRLGAAPHPRSPHVRGRDGPGAGRLRAVPLRHRGARAHHGPRRRADRRAADHQLRAHRRHEPRPARGLEREGPQVARQGAWSWSARWTGCSRATASSWTARKDTGVITRRGRASTSASPAPACAPAASTTTCARPSPTGSTTGSTSTCRWARTATTTTAT